MTQRKNFTPEFKAKVALEALKEHKTINQLAQEYDVYPTQISIWKKEFLEGMGAVFSDKRRKENKSEEGLVNELYQQIGQLKVEVDWLKKKSGITK